MKNSNYSVKKDFENWLKQNNVLIDMPKIDKPLIKESNENRLLYSSLFDEKDVLKIRLLVSDLVLKRDSCGIEKFDDYMHRIQLMIAYAEYLEKKYLLIEPEIFGKDKMRDTLTIAYYLSRVDKKALSILGYSSFSQAFKELAKILSQKSTTLKNMRDEFDPYFDNGRAGWYQRQLKGSRKEIYEKFKNISEKELTTIVKNILTVYTQQLPQAKNEHKKIIIKNQNMREFHTRKK